MRLMTVGEVEIRPDDLAFVHPRGAAAAIALAFAAAGMASAWFAAQAEFPPGWWIAGVIAVMLLVTRRMVTARYQPTNWLARVGPSGVYLQYRSYLNHRLPPQDRTVVFLPFAEIRAARRVSETRRTPDSDGGTVTRRLTWAELRLQGDLTALREALAEEHRRRPARGGLWLDYPLRITAEAALQVRWDVTPGVERFLQALGSHAIVEPSRVTNTDFDWIDSLSAQDQRLRLIDLVQAGDSLTAIRLARKIHGFSLAESKDFVESLGR